MHHPKYSSDGNITSKHACMLLSINALLFNDSKYVHKETKPIWDKQIGQSNLLWKPWRKSHGNRIPRKNSLWIEKVLDSSDLWKWAYRKLNFCLTIGICFYAKLLKLSTTDSRSSYLIYSKNLFLSGRKYIVLQLL